MNIWRSSRGKHFMHIPETELMRIFKDLTEGAGMPEDSGKSHLYLIELLKNGGLNISKP